MVKHCSRFAELIGIYMGDGNLGKYPRCQYLRIYFNPLQRYYIDYVTKLLIKQFHKVPYERYRKDAGVVFLEISLKDMDKYLGFPIGSKIKNQIRIPEWIFRNDKYLIRCLRGLFDTDGGIYVTGGKYKIVSITSHNMSLQEDLYNAFVQLGFHPYQRRSCIELGRMEEVKRFFEIVKPKNTNHSRFDK